MHEPKASALSAQDLCLLSKLMLLKVSTTITPVRSSNIPHTIIYLSKLHAQRISLVCNKGHANTQLHGILNRAETNKQTCYGRLTLGISTSAIFRHDSFHWNTSCF